MENPRDHIATILDRRNDGQPGYWTGNPHSDTMPMYLAKLGLPDGEALYTHFGDDLRWIPADSGYRHPEGRSPFDPYAGKQRESLNMAGIFAECESIAEVEAHAWPNLDYLDFGPVLDRIQTHRTRAVWTGLWSPFFHDVAEYFGMDNYFMAMFDRPEIVDAVTDRIVTYYEQANERFFDQLGDCADTFFFGNDFGTQRGLILSPQLFNRFVLPSMLRLIGVAKRHGKRVVLHSCGAISEVIPTLIEHGVDGLHPLQALATGMHAKDLAREFRGKIAFVGGVDSQDLLVNGTPAQVRDDVLRLRDLFGPNFVVSPSHEALLPNVPVENVAAMAAAARE
ncbi:MAG: uroporphyrinogen decarboxylase family protein [Fimbriimonas sp.]|nr:uroporphyrinogen decarboxylase family protein [Fimbriimonas sp.]